MAWLGACATPRKPGSSKAATPKQMSVRVIDSDYATLICPGTLVFQRVDDVGQPADCATFRSGKGGHRHAQRQFRGSGSNLQKPLSAVPLRCRPSSEPGDGVELGRTLSRGAPRVAEHSIKRKTEREIL